MIMSVFCNDDRYGESDGEPSEPGLKIDAMTAFDYVYNSEALNLDRNRIYLFGRSLGGAVAIYIAKQHCDKLAGVILENTFTSIGDMIKHVFPILDIGFVKKYMLRSEWKSIESIADVTCPLLFLSSENV
ncbi:hypothetical protein RFI_07552 [Reticulomyxa filosa]|uniref:Serine aminopeptidase S33 domain-containing protein n=1 Tax=Reticulomyxa filosa TaxID=46433 RepID=X6NUG5_RETFI|nr:hypothetical protein RFI_07552 [Reticulomyxa filosa]|eukprot:ETO29568.1 hypothetical protein RFI_07552 [Reticulomyxa filosa]